MNNGSVERLTWESDGSQETKGFRICLQPTQAFMSTGPCVADGSCITSSGYHPSANYGYDSDEDCDITPLMPGQLVVEAFQTEAVYDKLTIAGTDYESSNGPTGVVVGTSTIITWHSDNSVEDKGFRICLPRPSPAPTIPLSANRAGGPVRGPPVPTTVFASTGPCVVDGSCITSSGYPANYGNDEQCDITPLVPGAGLGNPK
eukprot:gene58105-biopygen29697